MLDLVEQRKVAKANKDWASADAIRAKINELGYVVKDTKDGSFAKKQNKRKNDKNKVLYVQNSTIKTLFCNIKQKINHSF